MTNITLTDSITSVLIDLGLHPKIASDLASITDFLIVLAISCVFYYIAKYIIISTIRRIAKRTKSQWDDIFLEKKVFQRLAHLLPAIIILHLLPSTMDDFPQIMRLFIAIDIIYIIIVFMIVLNSLLNALYALYLFKEDSKYHPIKGFIQVGKIIIFCIGSLFIFSFIFNQSPKYIIGGLGAFSAVLMLVFKDPILGFVGGLQLSLNDMVRIGDWISMPKFGADGSVKEISLTTVKVQNFDNTITTLPTYNLIADSFQNYRGMQESGVRRIKRSVSIDLSSVKFCTPEQLDKYRKIGILKSYIDATEEDLAQYNKEHNIDNSILVNGRRQTNIGIFRAYLNMYIKNHPLIDDNSDQLVRQLQPNATGIPIEVYAFVRETDFIKFEKIQSDIFDHILAIVTEFDLRIFQSPTGEDLRKSSALYYDAESI